MNIKDRYFKHAHFFLGDIVGAVLGVAGDVFAADRAADKSYDMNMAIQQRNIDWQREQLQNKHQWEVEDLRNAGLNPILSTHAASSAVSAGTPSVSAPQVEISKTLNAMANTALVRKQMDLQEYGAETDRIKANADMLRAKLEENKTPSAIDLNVSQSELNKIQKSYVENETRLHTLMNEANIREVDARIINATMQAQAYVEYLKVSGQAAMVSANAQASSAAAAWEQARNSGKLAQIAEANGISQRQLNDALAGKASEETKEAAAKVAKLNQEAEAFRQNNPMVFADEGTLLRGFSDSIGKGIKATTELVRTGLPNFSF